MRIPSAEPAALAAALASRGWAIAADVLSAQEVAALRRSVRDTCATGADLAVVERALAVVELLRNPRYLAVMRACVGEDDLVVHRSAALLRQPGTPGIHWHSDYDGYEGQAPTTPNARLNRGEWPNGAWFYLDGCRPERGGLAVMEGSHVPGWRPPTAWSFDLPGVVSIEAEPGDLILFAARTWHAAHPLAGIVRHSLGLALRPARVGIPVPEATPPGTRAFLAGLPADVAGYFRGYAGWLPDPR